MAYIKTTWVNGETPINADNLNHIENGIKNNETLINNITGTILWTNPNPNNAFSSQEITLSSGDYDILEIYYYDWVDAISFKDLLCQKTVKGYPTKLQMQLSYNGNSFSGNRRIRYVSDTKLQVDTGYAIIDSSNFNNRQADYWNVPIYIVGYKTGLFGGQS